MNAQEKIKSELAKKGQKVELELRGKEDTFYSGEVVELGDDYLLLARQVKVESDATKNEGTTYDVLTLILLADIRAFSSLALVERDINLSPPIPTDVQE